MRVSVACIGCSSAKLKCGDEKPCRRCLKKGIECIPPTNEDSNIRSQSSSLGWGADIPVTEERSEPNQELPPIPPPPRHQQHQEVRLYPQHQHQPPQEPSPLIFNSEALHQNLMSRNPDIQNQTSEHAVDMFRTSPSLEDQNTAESAIHDALSFDNASLGDFLADILMPSPPDDIGTGTVSTNFPESLVRDVFDFGNDTSFDLADLDFGLLNAYNPPAVSTYQQLTADNTRCPPSRAEGDNGPEVSSLSVEAFQRSLWRWQPGISDKGHGEQMNLSLPYDISASIPYTFKPLGEALAQPARDKILAMLFNTCEQDAFSRIVSQFPSVEILDHLLQEFLSTHDSTTDSYIHIPTFQPQYMRPELVAMAISYGAVCNTVPVVRKLGFALQEVVRLALPKAFEKDNSMTRDLQLLQTNILELNVGLWSGNKRKIEIAESHGLPLITMLRRAGRLKRLRETPAAPSMDDPMDVLDIKWRAWVVAESFKRLAFYIGKHDSQLSMSFHVPPLITYGEMTLDLPATSKLWKAGSPSTWRDEYLKVQSATTNKPPALAACIHDAHEMLEAQDKIDIVFSIDIALSLFWRVIWDARQLHGATKQYNGRPATMSLMSTHWQHELNQTLENFRMVVGEVQMVSSDARILQEHLFLNLYVSFEELSLFAGKEGHQEARRILPSLKQWAESRDSRQALWHAGQVIREAANFAPGTLQAFHAVSLYHAGLTLWAYGLLSQRLHRKKTPALHSNGRDLDHRGLVADGQDVVLLDGVESSETQKFIALNRAIPVITKRHMLPPVNQDAVEVVSLNDPKGVMETVISVLQLNHRVNAAPLLVENLTHLMHDLSRVANKVIRKG
ncbi:Nn.00g030000.m01.CDS01 [Neocucurbitaria sp. VM-36]